MTPEKLKQLIEQTNYTSDQKDIQRLRSVIDCLDTNDPKTKEIIELAREKGIY